jgi:hypothetical protein
MKHCISDDVRLDSADAQRTLRHHIRYHNKADSKWKMGEKNGIGLLAWLGWRRQRWELIF